MDTALIKNTAENSSPDSQMLVLAVTTVTDPFATPRGSLDRKI